MQIVEFIWTRDILETLKKNDLCNILSGFNEVTFGNKSTLIDRILEYQDRPTCVGCLEDQPNQLAHMGPGGCLHMEEDDDFDEDDD